MISYFKKKLSFLDVHTFDVLKKSSSSTLVKVGGMLFSLLVSIFLGRTLGPDGYGIINIANKIAGIFLILCGLGMHQVRVKEIAIAYYQDQWDHIGNVMYTSYIINGGFILLTAILLLFFAPFIADNVFEEPSLKIPLTIILLALVPQGFSRIFSSGLIGFNKIWQSNLVNQTLSSVIIGVLLLLMWVYGINITVTIAAIAYGLGRLGVSISIGVYWKKISSKVGRGNRKIISKKLLRTSLPLLLVGASTIIASNADAVMLGWLNNATQVGLYVVAARVALLTSFFLQVTNTAIAPKIASLYSKKMLDEMEIMVQQMTSILFFVAAIPFLIFIFFGDTILSIWGSHFMEAYWILVILSVGQFFNLVTGAASLSLIHCGEERIHGMLSTVFVTLNLLLNYLLISKYGAIGAAFATSFTVTSENIAKVLLVKKKIGIFTIPSFFFKKLSI